MQDMALIFDVPAPFHDIAQPMTKQRDFITQQNRCSAYDRMGNFRTRQSYST